jgi:mono/diheme cytochrome c family protein
MKRQEMFGRPVLWRLALLGLAWAGAASCKPEPGSPAGAADAPAREQISDAETRVVTPQAEADAAQIAEGREVAVRECSSCHALDADSISPNAEAPPLKTVLLQYDEDALATHLIEAVRVGHGDMPLFDFNVIGADALIAYLRSIRSPPVEQ